MLTRKVVFLSQLFAILVSVEAFVDGQMGWLLISLATPYCGYYGARSAISLRLSVPVTIVI